MEVITHLVFKLALIALFYGILLVTIPFYLLAQSRAFKTRRPELGRRIL